MDGHEKHYYVGHAATDQVEDSGWFVGQFAPEGLRRQTKVELKWGVHPDGETRMGRCVTGVATTISVLMKGALEVTLGFASKQHVILLKEQGDYIIYDRDVAHSWRAIGETIVLTIRFPSVEVRNPGKEKLRIRS